MGREHVLTDAVGLGRAETATFAIERQIVAIVRPADVDEVRACVHGARANGVPLYPVSRGCNWGLGSRVPTANGCALLDLSRLGRIVDYEEPLAHITVEPGVTFAQAYRYLRARGSPLYLPSTGGPADASVIGNAVERGDRLGPQAGHLNSILGLEVVLPTGDLVHTGLGRFSDASARNLCPWGVGPDLAGLFIQSNLGIVTQMTLALAPYPKRLLAFSAQVEDAADLPPLVARLRDLLLRGVLEENAVSLWNSYKVLACVGRYPWKLTGGRTPLALGAGAGRGAWHAAGLLHAESDEHAQALRALVEPALREVVRDSSFVDVEGSGAPLEVPGLLGAALDGNVRMAYWRKRTPPPARMDPDHDRCGLIWICPLLPLDGAPVVEAVRTAEETITTASFEPILALQCVSPRAAHAFFAIVYDRDVEGEDERAMACHDRLMERLVARGHLPYRLGVHSMGALPPPNDGSGRLLRALKGALDPADVLAPGRYDFRPD